MRRITWLLRKHQILTPREGSEEAAGTARGSWSKFSSSEKAVGEGWQVGNAGLGEELLSNPGIWLPSAFLGKSLHLPLWFTSFPLSFYPLSNRICVYLKSTPAVRLSPCCQPSTRPDES